MTYRAIVFRYQSLTDVERTQLREISGKYVTEFSVVAVNEEYHLIGVASDDENIFDAVREEVIRMHIAGLTSEWLTEAEEVQSLEAEFLAKAFNIRKTN